MKNLPNKIFIAEVVVFFLIITGVFQREIVPYFVAVLAIYTLIASLEDSAIFFTRSIPLFLAIPITTNFDSLNAWRILSILIFLKWFFQRTTITNLYQGFLNFIKQPYGFIKNHKVLFSILLLLLFGLLSIFVAPDKITAFKRIIYFINLSLIGIVINSLINRNPDFQNRIIKNLAIPVIIVALVGFAQLISTYFLDIYQFVQFWGERVQCNQFGQQWCQIAVQVGNTWFAYFGEQLSLRVFSLFPDSHSFPIFLLLGLPAIFALATRKLFDNNDKISFKTLIRTRTNLWIIFVPLIFLAAILSGTRGIWAASIGIIILSGAIIALIRKLPQSKIFTYLSSYLILFFLLFAVAYPIFVSPQFLLSKGDAALFGRRIKSIIDFGETSNKQRLEIWGKSWESIKKHPLLGVGIGNFPIVLGQDIRLAKAGSSAHNLYLHVAAEMGIPALIAALWFLWLMFGEIYRNFLESRSGFQKGYFGAALIFVPWVLIYSLTDPAIFDERAFLIFVITLAVIFKNGKSHIYN